MHGTNKSGIALIDLLLALAIIGLVSLIALPNIKKLLPGYTRQQFLSRFNGLVQTGWQRAIKTRAVHKILVDITEQRISLQRATAATDAKGNVEYTLVKDSYSSAPCSIPASIVIKQFFIEGNDEMARREQATGRVWFFIMPDGLTQNVIINMFDMNQQRNGKPVMIGLVLNPFSGQFRVYDEFQKP